ncbi:MAG: GAF domain-containing sensor histidine kinase [Chthoniobacteraceae bacterium]
MDSAVEDAQQLIVETMRLDQSILWELSANGLELVCTHVWQRPGWPSLPRHIISRDVLPWAFSKTKQGEVFSYTSVADLPSEAAQDVESIRLHGPKSCVTVPLRANGHVFGALTFATLGVQHRWREDEIAELTLVTQIISNVVGRQRAELREEQLRTELAHAMRVASLGELATAIAHELNQPLTAILSNAQAAKRFIASGELLITDFNEILEDIVRDSKRAGAVIYNLRSMISKRTAGPEMCRLDKLIGEVVELLHSELVTEKMGVHLMLAPNLPPVEAVCVELQQVLVNLVLNAVQAMQETARVKRFIVIETERDEGAAAVTIRDSGHGIPPDRLEAIFSPFFSTKQGGLGMGLAICRRIIETHGGQIEASNHPGGASFRFTLPFAPNAKA